VRGRVSRTLAAKLGIAARLDYYRGAEDKEFLRNADEAVKRAGEDQ
jgi:nucleolar protein 56